MYTLLIVNFFISGFMLGLILVTQIVSYPLFLKVEVDNFSIFHDDYVSRISFIAVPVMLGELFISTLVYYYFNTFLGFMILLSIILIFISTFIIQVPLHNKLKLANNRKHIIKLVNTNWIRTFLWFVKSIFSILIIFKETI